MSLLKTALGNANKIILITTFNLKENTASTKKDVLKILLVLWLIFSPVYNYYLMGKEGDTTG